MIQLWIGKSEAGQESMDSATGQGTLALPVPTGIDTMIILTHRGMGVPAHWSAMQDARSACKYYTPCICLHGHVTSAQLVRCVMASCIAQEAITCCTSWANMSTPVSIQGNKSEPALQEPQDPEVHLAYTTQPFLRFLLDCTRSVKHNNVATVDNMSQALLQRVTRVHSGT